MSRCSLAIECSGFGRRNGITCCCVAVACANDAVVVRGVPPGSQNDAGYRDLNLNANVHRSILYGRVGDAVRNVCDFTDFTKGTDYRTCRTKCLRRQGVT